METGKKVMLALLVIAAMQFTASAASPCETGGVALSTAPWYCNQINSAVQNVWATWAPIVMIAVFFSFSVAAVIFMSGIVFRSEKVRNFGIGELYEAVATALIALLFMSLAAVLFGLVPALTVGPVNPYVTALTYISNTATVTQTAMTNLLNVVFIDMFYGTINTAVQTNGLPSGAGGTVGGFLTGSAFGNGSGIASALTLAVFTLFIIPARALLYLLLDGILVLNLQFYLMLFFMYTAIPVFLVPGIIFRSIFPVRNMGGIMIAIAIAFYMIIPTLFSVAYYFTNTGLTGSLGAYGQLIANDGAGTLAQTNAASLNAPLVQDVKGLQSLMGSYWLSILFYPTLIGAIGYESIRIIAQLIGGAVRTTGKLKAV
jgi:hypothetical protein